MKIAAICLLSIITGAAYGAEPTALFLLDAQPNIRQYSMGGVFSSLNFADAANQPWELGYAVTPAAHLAHWPGAVKDSAYNFASVVIPYRKWGGFSVSYLNYGTGSETIEELDGTTRSIQLESNKVMALGWGRNIGQHLFAGGSIKMLNSTLADTYSASTLLKDVGLVYRALDDKYTIGVAMVNAGGRLKYSETSEPVPSELKLGLTRKTTPMRGQKIVWGLGYAKSDVDKTTSLGAEWFPNIPFVSVRAGASKNNSGTRFAAGLGLNWNSVDLDFGYDLSSDRMESEQSPVRFALSWTFGPRGVYTTAEKYVAKGMKDKAVALWENIRPGEQQYAQAQSAIQQYANPPELYAEAVLKDSNGDGVLAAGEQGKIIVTVGNRGRGKATSLRCQVVPADQKTAAFNIETGVYDGLIEGLEPGQSVSFDVPVKALEETEQTALAYRVDVKEARGFNAESKLFTLDLRGFSPLQLALARYTFKEDGSGNTEGNGNGIIEKGETVEVTGYVVNAGAAEARNAAWEITGGGLPVNAPSNKAIGTLAPGAARKIVFVFSVPKDYSGSAMLPLTVKLSEERARFNKNQPLKLALGSFYKDPFEPVFPDFDTAQSLAAVPALPGPVSDAQAQLVVNQIAATPPALEFEQQLLRDGDVNGNGVYEPGDTLKIKVSIRNTGGQAAQDVRVRISGDETAATLLGEQVAGDIAPGGNRVVLVQARVPDNVPRKESSFDIRITEGRGFNATKVQEARVAFQPKEVQVIKQLASLLPVPKANAGRKANAAAVVVGIGGYKNFAPLKYAAKDAEAARDYLNGVMGIPAENIKIVTESDATKTTIVDKWVDWLAAKKGLDTIVFYFAGHGVPDPANPKDGDTYLAPYDGDTEARGTLIGLPDLIAKLESSAASNVLVILDACYSGLKGSRGLMAGPVFKQQKAVVLAGANSGQQGFEFDKAEHGYFTYYSMLGLKGEADAAPYGNADGAVTSRELCSYVKAQIADATDGRQTPVCNNEGDMVMGRYR